MLSPIKTVFLHYPLRAFITILFMICTSILAYWILKKKNKRNEITKQKAVVGWLLINYSVLLLFFTVLGRRSFDYYRYNFDFGYSYRAVFILKDDTLADQILVNILMFVSVGMLVGIITKQYIMFKSLLYGTLLSLLIEVLQLVLKRGYFEFDDLLSNIIGTFIGCLIVKVGCCLRKAGQTKVGG